MRVIGRILKWVGGLVLLMVIAGFGWLYLFPPDLLRVADAYSAKIVCSNYFLAGRDPQQVLGEDVQAPGNPVLKYVSVKTHDEGYISANMFGIFATEYAVNRPGLGCANVPDHDIDAAIKIGSVSLPAAPPESDYEWPLGDQVTLPPDEAVKAVIADATLAGPGVRAIVVVKDGHVIAERYDDGFSEKTPLLGWSMTKTVNGALVAMRVAAGKLSWTGDHLFADWTDDRAKIKISDLMAMQSGLKFDEDYGDVTDVTRMLFLEPDQPHFVETRAMEAKPGTKFSYSTGTAVVLARLWMNTFATSAEALAYPRQALFNPIGMRSAVLETDSRGNYSGGSLLYATARDWARFGLLLLDKGVWNGERVLPEDYATMVSTPSTASKGVYTQAQSWIVGPQDISNTQSGLPADTFWAEGHDGQSIAIIPSEKLVVVRLGLTPSRTGYAPQALVAKIIAAAKIPPVVPPAQ